MDARKSLEMLSQEMKRMGPHLGEVMQFGPRSSPEGLGLRDSVCGFACNVLAKTLNRQRIGRMVPKIGTPFDDVSMIPERMRRHVVVTTEAATLDPTWGQFMALVGLDVRHAASMSALKDLYPEWQIAVIPRGTERIFGERFASFALEQAVKLRHIWSRMDTGYFHEGVDTRLPEEQAFEMLADIWSPKRYRPFDNAGDGDAQAEKAANRLQELLGVDPV